MKAVIQRRYGGSETLSLGEVEAPRAGRGEIVVAVEAAPITQGDRRLREADFPGVTKVFGRLITGLFRPRNTVPGSNYAGMVAEVGPGVERFSVGDRVLGACFSGAHAQRVRVRADGAVALVPDSVSVEAASTLPYGLGTATVFLDDIAQVAAGERVLILGASGSVGSYAVQLARHRGAKVHAMTRRPDDEARLRGLGAAAVYATPPSETFDVIFDTTGAFGFARMKRLLAAGGRYLTLYLSLGILAWMAWTALRGGRRAYVGVAEDSPEVLARIIALVRQGSIEPLIDEVYPFSSLRAAHDRLEAKPTGTVVLRVTPAVSAAGAGTAA